MVKDHSDSERGNQLLPHGLLFPISSKGSFICIIPDRLAHTTAFVKPVVEHLRCNQCEIDHLFQVCLNIGSYWCDYVNKITKIKAFYMQSWSSSTITLITQIIIIYFFNVKKERKKKRNLMGFQWSWAMEQTTIHIYIYIILWPVYYSVKIVYAKVRALASLNPLVCVLARQTKLCVQERLIKS